MKKRGGRKGGLVGKRGGKSSVRREGARPAARPLRGANVAPEARGVHAAGVSKPFAAKGRTIRRPQRARGLAATTPSIARAVPQRVSNQGVNVVFRTPELLEVAERLDPVSADALREAVDPGDRLGKVAGRFVRAVEKVLRRVALPERLSPRALSRLFARVELLERLEDEARALYEKYRDNRAKAKSDAWRAILDAWAHLKRVAAHDAELVSGFGFMADAEEAAPVSEGQETKD